MKKVATKAAKQVRIIKIGETYRDVTRGALATVLDHEIVCGKRTGRVIVMGTRKGEHFPQPWICAAKDLVEIEESCPATASRGGHS